MARLKFRKGPDNLEVSLEVNVGAATILLLLRVLLGL
jgi:hypothetical protein